MGSVPAMTNRGNLALIEKDYAAAERWFRQALERDPENAAALRGVEKINAQRE
jgi:Tfp pilus assembly protein PilF